MRSTAFARTSVMSDASGIETGHTVSQALQPRHMPCSYATLSGPWCHGETTSPIGPV